MSETCKLTPFIDDNSNPSTRKKPLEKYNKLLQFLSEYKDTDTSGPRTLEDILQILSRHERIQNNYSGSY